MKYKIYPTLHEESNNGWVWLFRADSDPRSVIRLCHKGRTVYCEWRRIDENFIAVYNSRLRTDTLSRENQDTLVVSDWYRRALEIKNGEAEVETGKAGWWGELKAGSQHPDPRVRLATRLGILGAWLGLSGLLFALTSLFWQRFNALAATLSVILGLLSLLACRGVRLSGTD